MFVEGFGWCLPAEGLAGSAVEGGGDGVELVAGCSGRGRCLWGSTGAAGRWCSRWCRAARGCAGREVDGDAGVDLELGVLGHLLAAVPGQRAAQLLGQGRDRRGERVPDCFGAVAGERRAVLGPGAGAVAFHAGQVQQHREPGGALDQRADRGAFRPMIRSPSQWPGHGPVLGLGGPLADHHLGRDVALAAAAGPGSRAPAAPGRCAGRRPARACSARGPGRRGPGRSPRGRSAWTHHRGSRPAAGCAICSGLHALAQRRSARAACGGGRSTRTSGPGNRLRRRACGSHRRAGPGRSRAAARWRPASRPSAGAPAARHATARSTPGSPAATSASTRCAAAPARSSTATGPAAARSPAHPTSWARQIAMSSRSANDR